MHQTELITKIITALSKALDGKDLSDLPLTTQLRDDLGLDSMTSLTFLMALEEEITGFVVDPDSLRMDDLYSIDSIAHYVSFQLSHR